jgi:hypothetical protein
MRVSDRFCVVAALLIAGLAFPGSARAQLYPPLTDADRDKIIAMLHTDLKLRAEAQRELEVSVPQKTKTKKNAPNVADSGNPIKPSAQAAANAGQNPPPSTPNLQSSGVSFLLRNDWADLGVLGACLGGGGVSTDKAKGASLSFTQNYVANNRIWAAQAMGAAVYSECDLSLRPKPGGGDSGFVEKSLAIYAQVNSSYNSNSTLTSKNTDTRTAGLAGEIAYLHSGDYEVVRLTPNVVQDAIKGTEAVAVKGQYIPVWVSQPGIWHTTYIFGGNVSYQFDPTLDVQYASTTDPKKPLLFSGKDQSLRVGPELTLIVSPLLQINDWLSRIAINETFHPWYEAYSSNTSMNYWWANAITYNLTSDGNFALGFSYNKGRDENSGTLTNQYIVSLNGKI